MSTHTYNCSSVRMAIIPTTAGRLFIPIYKVNDTFPELSNDDHYTFNFSNLSVKASIMANSTESVEEGAGYNLVHEFTRFYTSKKAIGLNSAKEFHIWTYNKLIAFPLAQQSGTGMSYPYYLVPFILVEDNVGKGFALVGAYLINRTATSAAEAGRDWYTPENGYPFEEPTPSKLGYAVLKMNGVHSRHISAAGEIPATYKYQRSLADFSPELSRYYFNKIMEYISNGAYDGIDGADIGGNTGTYDFTTSDDIDFPSLPTLSAVNTGFVSLWSPTNEQMLNLSRYMWNADILTADFWKKLTANPMELIFGLNIIPVDLRAQESYYIGTAHNVVVGLRDTQIEMDTVTSQWIEYDCGYIDVSETWGAYLDYDPYTKLDIYLPFCGVHPIHTDDFMPGRIHVKYHIDLLSGSCVALIKSTKTDEHGDVLNSVVYQFMGNCATQIPVTSAQYADAVRSAISIAASVGTLVAGGIGTVAGAAKSAKGQTLAKTRIASDVINTGASIGENVMNLKPSIERSGAIGSSAALLSVQVPYLILTRPRQAKPNSQQTYTGYPSFITEDLVDLKGWTEVQAIHLEGIPCTVNELSEINELLKSGVIF